MATNAGIYKEYSTDTFCEDDFPAGENAIFVA
jgi:hypothetical protein